MGMIKTAREIKFLEKAAQIANSCIPLIEKSLREKNITERELARRVRKKINSQGATLSFQTLVGSGKRSAMIHTKPHTTDEIINGIGYIDYGASYKGYKTDMTVPFIKGKVSENERKIVKTNLRAYKLAVKSIKVGMPCWLLHKIVDDFMRKNGFKMKHSLGHGLGLKAHDIPTQIGISRKIIARKNKLRGKRKKKLEKIMSWTFQPNMVFTIEPGIYIRNFGTRIENSFIMLKSKRIKSLTNSHLIEV